MKRSILLLLMAFLFSCNSNAQKPTKEDVTKVIKATWEREKTDFQAKCTVIINDIKFGTSEKSNYAMQLNGIPKGALVTHAKIDFTQQTFHNTQTELVRRVTTAYVYKDKFKEWAVMNNGTKYIK